jgi:hypothetical protein
MWDEEISEGAHVGTTTHQGAPGGAGAPRWVVPTWSTSLCCYLHQKLLNIQKKIVLNFYSILRTFIFGSFFYCTENRQGMAFYFI